MDAIRTKLAFTALYSRLLILFLSFSSNLLIPDHDAGVFQWTVSPRANVTSYSDHVVHAVTSGLTRWDGQYFLHIANSGYSYENTLAFFPLYPYLVRVAGDVIYWMQVDYGLIHYSNAIRLAGVLVNIVCFVCATLLLFDLSRKVLRDDYLAYKSALLFTINPASIFFSATYSESIHALLSFYVMLKLEKAFTIQMGFLLALSSAVRSNGLINLGFAAYKSAKLVAREIAIHQRLKYLQRDDFSETLANIIGDAVLPGILSALMSVCPFALFQWFAFTQYCGVTKPKFDYDEDIIAYANDHALKLPSADPSSWCQGSPPIPYFYIQDHYWNVGFLRYFQLKQIPNFLLAAPVLVLTVRHCLKFIRCHRFYCSRLGFTYFNMDPSQKVPAFDVYKSRVLPKECFVYMVHALFLCIFCTFFVHVQISTRMILSSSPVVLWIAALITTPEDKKSMPVLDLDKPEMVFKLESAENLESAWKSLIVDEKGKNPESKWIRLYFCSYAFVGTVLFSNFLPWT